MAAPTAVDQNITVTITGSEVEGEYTASSTGDPAVWGAFAPTGGGDMPAGLTISWSNGKVTAEYTTTDTETEAPEFETSHTAAGGGEPIPDETTVTEAGPVNQILTVDLTTAETGDTVEVSVDGVTYTAELTKGDTITVGKFVDEEGNDLGVTSTVADDNQSIILTTAATVTDFAVEEAIAYLGKAPETTDPEGTETEGTETPYSNTGRDIIQLDTNFGDDALVDFVSGVDRINVHDLGLSSTTVGHTATAQTLDGNQAIVATVGTAKADTGIFIKSEVDEFVAKGAIAWGGSNYGSAVVLLAEDNAAGQNVYTAALVTKASASATTTATVMGSLTLAAGEEIATADLVGVSQLVDDPDLASA